MENTNKVVMDVDAVQCVCSQKAVDIMCTFNRRAQSSGWQQDAINAVLTEAIKGDYEHLICTLRKHSEPPPSNHELTLSQVRQIDFLAQSVDGFRIYWEHGSPVFEGYVGAHVACRRTITDRG